MEVEATLKIYTNQPERLPKKSSRGNQYIMVLAEVDSNAILVEHFKYQESQPRFEAHRNLYKIIISSNCYRIVSLILHLVN
jgi:hypothetical protein